MAALAVALPLLLSSQARACSCAPPPTVDVAADATPTIALFTVQSTVGSLQGSNDELAARARLTVERVFKGDLKVGESFEFSSEGLCTFQFYKDSTGSRYLLYLDKRPASGKLWTAGLCTRSGRLGARGDDILYLEKMNRVRGKTRLSGTVSQQLEGNGEPREWYFRSLAGVPVRIRGNGQDIVLKTNENGAYEVYDLRPGKYEITVPNISGFTSERFAEEPRSAQIIANKHTEESIFYEIDNSIRGTLVDEHGTPVAGACLELVPTSHTLPLYSRKSSCTDVKGEFHIFEILSGTYILVGNKDNKMTAREPFPTYYYPGTRNVAGAQRFTFAPGVHFTGMIMKTPSFDGVVNVSGLMRFKGGAPVEKARIRFFSGASSRDEVKDFHDFEAPSAETDEKGFFRIRVPMGQKGVLIGSFTAYKDDYRNCPQIMKLIKADDLGWKEIESPAVHIDAGSEVTGIELEYPFSGCAKSKQTTKSIVLRGLAPNRRGFPDPTAKPTQKSTKSSITHSVSLHLTALVVNIGNLLISSNIGYWQ